MIHFLKSFFLGEKGLNPDLLLIITRLFNEAYYLENNHDVAKSKINPLEHYLKRGCLVTKPRLPMLLYVLQKIKNIEHQLLDIWMLLI